MRSQAGNACLTTSNGSFEFMARRGRRDSYSIGGEEVREESGWRYPLIIFVATLLLSAFVLVYYFAPTPEEIVGEVPRPSVSEESVVLTVGGIAFDVPANHTVYPRDRRPGPRERLALYAAWPRMDGYTTSRRNDFIENRPNSRRIDVIIETNNTPFDEGQRFRILYSPHVTEAGGVPFEHGLTKYEFANTSRVGPAIGYQDRVMYVGQAPGGEEAIIFCDQHPDEELIPPECSRYYDINEEVWVRYFFKEPFLAEWRRIDAAVHEFVDKLRLNGRS
ncbi:MAG: hypothetical protein AAGG79_00765 [Pseudomonadota bacterium]